MNKFFILFRLAVGGTLLLSGCKPRLQSDRSFAGDGKVYRLRMNPSPGSIYQYEMTNGSNVKMTVNEKAVESIKKADVTLTYAVNEDSAGHFVISITYDKIHTQTKTGDQETDLNSETTDDTGDPMQKMLQKLKNATIVATLDTDGSVKTVTGYSDVASQILGSTEAISLPDKQRLQQQWRSMVEQAMIKKNMDQLLRFFPDSAVHVGDRWKTEARDSAEFPFLVKSTYQLQSIKNGIANIECRGDITSDSSRSGVPGMANAAELKGQQRGSYSVDIKTGMLTECKVTVDIEGTMQVMGRDIPITISTEVEIAGTQIK